MHFIRVIVNDLLCRYVVGKGGRYVVGRGGRDVVGNERERETLRETVHDTFRIAHIGHGHMTVRGVIAWHSRPFGYHELR